MDQYVLKDRLVRYMKEHGIGSIKHIAKECRLSRGTLQRLINDGNVRQTTLLVLELFFKEADGQRRVC